MSQFGFEKCFVKNPSCLIALYCCHLLHPFVWIAPSVGGVETDGEVSLSAALRRAFAWTARRVGRAAVVRCEHDDLSSFALSLSCVAASAAGTSRTRAEADQRNEATRRGSEAHPPMRSAAQRSAHHSTRWKDAKQTHAYIALHARTNGYTHDDGAVWSGAAVRAAFGERPD